MEVYAGRREHELVAALGIVGFELRMMAHAFGHLRRAEPADEDALRRNAYIDSAYLHARVLVEFFVGSGRGSDIRRTDFTVEWTPKPTLSAKRLDDSRRQLNKYLAHLTWERVSSAAPALEYPGIATDVMEVAAAWLDHLLAENQLMGEVFRPHVSIARQTLDDADV